MPDAYTLRTQWAPCLDQHMWVEIWDFRTAWRVDSTPGASVAFISGLLKPQPNEGGGRAIRRMYMDVLDELLHHLDELGATHRKHPDIDIRGDVLHSLDDFTNMRCHIRLELQARPA